VDSCFFPIFEIEKGLTSLSDDPEKAGKKIPVSKWLEMMGAAKHLLKPEHENTLHEFQAEVDRRWTRLKARAEHPLL
jgi:pyruvate ferredoxin oxidoreductase alpha subunit